MKCVLQINGFSGLRPRVRSNRRVGSGQGGATDLITQKDGKFSLRSLVYDLLEKS